MTPTPETLRMLFAYDKETGVVTRKIRTANCTFIGQKVGSRNGRGYLTITIEGRTYQLHRVIFAIVTGQWPALGIDHINRDPGDNRWINLREATYSENGHNRGVPLNNTTGVKGVSRYGNRFRAERRVDNVKYYLGTFNTVEEAKQALEK